MWFKYPYTSYSELNLDWFLEQFKKLKDEWDTTSGEWDQMQLDFQTLEGTVQTFTTFVTHYFDNLDVQQEINNKLDAMAQDGTLADLLAPLVDDKLPDVVDDKLGAVVTDQLPDVVTDQLPGVVSDQIDNAVATPAATATTAWLEDNVDPVGSAVTIDSSLTIAGSAADAKVVGDIFTEITDVSKNIWTGDVDNTFTKSKTVPLDYPAGTYTFSAEITSNDTDSTTCLFLAFYNDTVIASVQLDRGSRVSTVITAPDGITSVTMHASNTGAHSTGDTASWNDIQLETGSVATDFVLPGKTAKDSKARDEIDVISSHNQNIWPSDTDISFTKSHTISGIDISAGTYTISAAVTSSDTDASTCLMYLTHNGNDVASIQFERGNRCSRTIILSEAVDTIKLYASNNNTNSTGDTASWNDIQIETGKIATAFVEPGTTANDSVARGIADVIADRYLNTPDNKVQDLKILCFGDSILGNDGETVEFLRQFTKADIFNMAVGGTSVSPRVSTSDPYYPFDGQNLITAFTTNNFTAQDATVGSLSGGTQARYAAFKNLTFSDYNLIILAWGTNDYTQGKTIQQINSAYDICVSLIQQAYPEARILVLCPIWRFFGDENNQYTEDSDTKVYNVSTLLEISKAIEENCKYKRISVFNGYENMELSMNNATTYFDNVTGGGDEDNHSGIELPSGSGQYYSGVHLNLKGNKMYAHCINGKIASMY